MKNLNCNLKVVTNQKFYIVERLYNTKDGELNY